MKNQFRVFGQFITAFVPAILLAWGELQAVQASRYMQMINPATECTEFFVVGRGNPANIAIDDGYRVIAEIFPYKFQAAELQPMSILAGGEMPGGVFAEGGLCGVFSDIFSEYSYIAKIAGRITENWALGAGAEFSNFRIKNANHYAAYSLSLGTSVAISEIYTIGISSHFANQYDNKHTKLQRLSAGIGTRAWERFAFDVGANYLPDETSQFYVAAKAIINDNIAFRIAVMTEPNTLEAGAYIKLNETFAFAVNAEKTEMLALSSYIQLRANL